MSENTGVVPFVDLQAAYRRLQTELDDAVACVMASGRYILGEQVNAFEAEFGRYMHGRQVVSVASGTDAVMLALRAAGVGPGDEVITVSHTAVATVTAIELAGASPRFVDISPVTLTMDPTKIAPAITGRTRAIMPVHLYGGPADMDSILAIAHEHGLAVIEDCAQAHGASYRDRPVGTMGNAAAFSFYPTKNLGAMGDGGAVVTSSTLIAGRLKLLRQYGWQERYISDEPGYNSRLDELQAAILRMRLAHLDEENDARRRLAASYDRALAGLPISCPHVDQDNRHVYHLYVIRVDRRDELQAHLRDSGISSAIHYPVPVHLQPAYARLGYAPGSLPVSEAAARTVLSLPIYPDMPPEAIERVITEIAGFFR